MCVCEEPGPFNCGLPGILAGQLQRNGYRYIERCDTCERFSSDEAACEIYSKFMGGRLRHNRQGKVIFLPE